MTAPIVETRWIDASHHNGVTPWASLVTGYRIDAGVAKCTEGMTFTDDQYARSRLAVRAARIVFGGYHYSSCSASWTVAEAAAAGTAQGNRFAGICGLKAGELAVLDHELSNGLGQSAMNAFALAWGRAVKAKLPGVSLWFYGPRTYISNETGRNLVQVYDGLWTARYPGLTQWPTTVDPGITVNTTGLPVASWQWTDNVGGRDASVCSLTVAELRNPALQMEGPLNLSSTEFDQLSALIAQIPALTLGQPIPSLRPETLGHPIALRDYIAAIDLDTRHPPADIGVALAAAIVANLPANTGGGLTQDQVEAAVVAGVTKVLTTGTNGATS